jgi:hypothetical protein
MMSTERAAHIAWLTHTYGGTTVDPAGGPPPMIGYAVALPGLETTYPHTPDDQHATAARISAYADAHRADLAGDTRYLGTWVDAGKLYVDTVEIYTDRAAAELAGIAARQLAIFDLATGTEIALAPQVTP